MQSISEQVGLETHTIKWSLSIISSYDWNIDTSEDTLLHYRKYHRSLITQ